MHIYEKNIGAAYTNSRRLKRTENKSGKANVLCLHMVPETQHAYNKSLSVKSA